MYESLKLGSLWTCICWVLVGKTEGKRPLGRLRYKWEDNIKMDLQEVGCWDVGVWTGLSWLRIGTGGRLLWMQWWTVGFHKMQGIYWPAANQLASLGLWSVDWVSRYEHACKIGRPKTVFTRMPTVQSIIWRESCVRYVLGAVIVVSMVILFKTSFHTKSDHSIMSDDVESFLPLKFQIIGQDDIFPLLKFSFCCSYGRLGRSYLIAQALQESLMAFLSTCWSVSS
jgi:hypothetical protein